MRRRGFSLVELVVIIATIAALTGIFFAAILEGAAEPANFGDAQSAMNVSLESGSGKQQADRASGPADDERPQPEQVDTATAAWGVLALTSYGEKDSSAQFRADIDRAVATIGARQWDESRGVNSLHPLYGGIGRDRDSTPDLLHTALGVQAMRGAGVSASDVRVRRARSFILRCQASEPRSGGLAVKGDDWVDGGFVGRPRDGGASGHEPVSRPCGALTCLGLTSLLSAGLSRDDERVQRALKWLQAHYTLDVHPGMARGREGLYGYYFELAKAMSAIGCEQINDRRGASHNWREELKRRLAAEQNADGSWSNPEESREAAVRSPVTVTSYAVLTLLQIRH